MQNNKRILIICGVSTVVFSIGLIIVIIAMFFQKDKQPLSDTSDSVLVTTESELETSENPNIPDGEVIDVPVDAESVYHQGTQLMCDQSYQDFQTVRQDYPVATDESIQTCITEARRAYRYSHWSDGSSIISSFANKYQMPDNTLGRELIALYYDSGITSNLEHFQGTETTDSTYETMISRIKDPETYLLAVLDHPKSYVFYLDKDSIYLTGTMGLFSQGEILDKSDIHYTIAEQYVTPQAVYLFPLRYNNEIMLDAYVVTTTDGNNHLLSIENLDGTYTLPYEMNGGEIPDLPDPIITKQIEGSGESNTDNIYQLFTNTTLSDEAIDSIIGVCQTINISNIINVQQQDSILIVQTETKQYLLQLSADETLDAVYEESIDETNLLYQRFE